MTELWIVQWLHSEDADVEENWQFKAAYETEALALSRSSYSVGKGRVRKFVPAEENLRLFRALKSRCVCDDRGYYDYDVAEWFDPGQPYEDLEDGTEETKQ